MSPLAIYAIVIVGAAALLGLVYIVLSKLPEVLKSVKDLKGGGQ